MIVLVSLIIMDRCSELRKVCTVHCRPSKSMSGDTNIMSGKVGWVMMDDVIRRLGGGVVTIDGKNDGNFYEISAPLRGTDGGKSGGI